MKTISLEVDECTAHIILGALSVCDSEGISGMSQVLQKKYEKEMLGAYERLESALKVFLFKKLMMEIKDEEPGSSIITISKENYDRLCYDLLEKKD